MYKLIAEYKTGNSFGSEDTSDVIHEFESKEVATAAMNRLAEHYRWYKWDDKSEYDKARALRYNDHSVEEPEWHKKLEYNFQANYYNELGNLVQMCAPYCGYFEKLYGLKIETNDEIRFD